LDPAQHEARPPRLISTLIFSKKASTTLHDLWSAIKSPYVATKTHTSLESTLIFPYLPIQHTEICIEAILSLRESWALPTPVFFPFIYTERNGLSSVALKGAVSSSEFRQAANKLRYRFIEKLPSDGGYHHRIDWNRRLRFPLCNVGRVGDAEEKLKLVKKLYPHGLSLGFSEGMDLVACDIPALPTSQKLEGTNSKLIWSSRGNDFARSIYVPGRGRVPLSKL
jgi:hypothetical protein